jgi:alkanesulfonate monooxygenase SsuD/methylene tetrahydromethanopterin reductase-like flavin-dependent oxidoreductase (luciferase family)
VVFENVRSTSSFRESDRRFEALSLRQRICLPIGRYTSGGEFMEVVKALWDSWATDAVIDDPDRRRLRATDRIRSINHRGDFYTAAGPLNMPRCPQGRPVMVQAGSSDTGRRA